MTISTTDADAFIKASEGIINLIANAIDLDAETGLRTCESLDKLCTTMLAMASSSSSIEPYIWGNLVTILQLAISRRHVTG